METVVQEKMNDEIGSYRIEIDSKVKGVKEGIHRVIEEKVKREKDIVDSRISTLRKQMDDNQNKIG